LAAGEARIQQPEASMTSNNSNNNGNNDYNNNKSDSLSTLRHLVCDVARFIEMTAHEPSTT
jgi:hypothetical protein